MLTEEQLASALAEQARTQAPLGQVLQARGWISPLRFMAALADQLELDWVDVTRAAPRADALHTVPADVARQLNVLPLHWRGDTLHVAMADPLDIDVLEELDAHAHATICPVVADHDALAAAIEAAYERDATRHAHAESRTGVLRAKIEALHAEGHTPRTVVCAAGAPGVGLTHVVFNIAAAAAAAAHRTIVVDASLTPHPDLRPAAWDRESPGANLVRGNGAPPAVSPLPGAAGIAYIGGATGAALRDADLTERLTFAEQLLTLGETHDVLVCDLGCAPLDAASEVLLAADVPLLVTTAQDIVSTYDLLRDMAAERGRRHSGNPDSGPWTLGLVATFVDSGPTGRNVFDYLEATVQRHVNGRGHHAGQVQLGFLGTVPLDRDAASTAERTGSPALAADAESLMGQGARDVAAAILGRVRRVPADRAPFRALLDCIAAPPVPRR